MEIKKLTGKQRKFVEFYQGNATEAARLAGYKGTDLTLRQIGHQNLTKLYISQAIKARQDTEERPYIATRQDRQKFWADVMNDESQDMTHRLRAAELLGKSEADFTEKQQVSGPDGGPQIILTMPANGSEKKD